MNIALRNALTVSEYLAWAERQSERQRTELMNGQIVGMAPERVEHILLKGRIFVALLTAFRASGLRGQVFTDGLTVPIDTHTAYKPDALVHLGSPLDAKAWIATDPIVVVEVLSPSTAHTDTSAKLIGYFKVPSVMHYLIADPVTGILAHHWRTADGGIGSAAHAAGSVLLDPPGLQLSVDEIFRDS